MLSRSFSTLRYVRPLANTLSSRSLSFTSTSRNDDTFSSLTDSISAPAIPVSTSFQDLDSSPSSKFDYIADATDSIPTTIVDVASAINAVPDSTTYWEALGFFEKVGYFAQSGIEIFNTSFGLPWWGCVIAFTIASRLVLTPISIYQIREASKMKLVRKIVDDPALDDISSDEKLNLQIKLFKEFGANPLISLLFIVAQAPLFMSMFFGTQQLCYRFPQLLESGGTLWFPVLGACDPLYILPLLSGATLVVSLEWDGETTSGKTKQIGRWAGFLTTAASIQLPAATSLYWITNNAYSFALMRLTRVPAVAQLLNLIDPKDPHAAEKLRRKHMKVVVSEVTSVSSKPMRPSRNDSKK